MNPRHRHRPYVITSLLLSSAAATLPAATLHFLEPSAPELFAFGQGISTTGTVAGFSTSFDASSPALWVKSGATYAAPASLPSLSGANGGEVRWFSADGALAAGFSALPSGETGPMNYAPVLWTRGSTGAYTISALPRLGATPAEGVIVAGSANGARLVGSDGATDTATVWRGAPGSAYAAQALPLPAGANGPSFATAASANGTRLAGLFTNSASAQQAVVWTESNGSYSALALAAPAGATQTFAETLSADGALVAGSSENSGRLTATKWDAANGQPTLLEARAGADTTALSVSSDKHWIGGRATDRADLSLNAVLWNADGKIFTLSSLATDVNFGGFVPGEVSAIQTVSPGVYTVVGTGLTLATGQTRAFVIENLALAVPTSTTTPGTGTTNPTTTTPTPSTPTTTTPTEPAPTTSTPSTGTTTPPATTSPTPDATLPSAVSLDPNSADSRTLIGDAFAALLDPARAAQSRFGTDQAGLRPLRAAFPGTTRDSLLFDGTRMLPGPRSQDLFAPGVAQDLGLVGLVRIPATGGSGKAVLFTVNRSDAEPAIALGYDYGQSRFYVQFLQAFNGAPSEIAGASSPRGGTYVVRLQKTGGTLSLRVDGALLAETTSARPAILASGQSGRLGIGGIRELTPQFVGQLGKFYFRNSALNNTEAAALEADLRSTWLSGASTGTTTPTTPTTTTPTAPSTTTPPPTTSTPTEPAPSTTAPSTVVGGFDPASTSSRTLVGDAFSALLDPARSTWRFATDQSSLRPTRVAFPGTSRDSLSFDGSRMLPGPRSSDLFTPGVTQDMGMVAAVRIPASGGSGKAHILTVNLTDTEPAVAIGYDYSANRFFARYTLAFNGAPGEISGGSAPRGASYVVRLQKTGNTVRLRVNGVIVAETSLARPAILATGQNGNLGLGGIRALNPQFVGQVGKFHLRNATLTDTEAAALEADVRAWITP